MKVYIISDSKNEKVEFLRRLGETLQKKGNNRAVFCIYNDADREFYIGNMNESPEDLFLAAAHIKLLGLQNYGAGLIEYINGRYDEDDGKEKE